MKIPIRKDKCIFNSAQFLRSAGYIFITDHKTGKGSFVRKLTRERYPRFHIYTKQTPDLHIIDLHIDQKKASYAGQNMHSAEYDGEVVEREISRLKFLIAQSVKHKASTSPTETNKHLSLKNEEKQDYKQTQTSEFSKIGHGKIAPVETKKLSSPKQGKPKSWIKKIFS